MAARKKTRKRQRTAPPAPIPTPEEIHRQRLRIHKARPRVGPPHVRVIAVRPDALLAPEAGHGYAIYVATSYAVTNRELERAIVYGFQFCPPKWTP